MNDEEFFNLLNQYPMRSDNPSATTTQTSSQPTNLFSIFNNMMGGMNRNQNQNQNQNQDQNQDKKDKEREFLVKLKQFLDNNVNNQEEADLIFTNFKKNHLKYIKENNLQ
ncbi:hypothetical protein ACTFIZ_003303 [Dictyostelium cf. discoideum]